DTLLSTESGKSVVMTALGKALLNGSCTNATFEYMYLNALYEDSTYVAAYLDQIPFVTSTYDEPISITVDGTTYTTVASYLSYIYSTMSTSYLQQIVGYSVDNIDNFRKVLSYLFDTSSGYYSYIESLSEGSVSYYTWLSNCYSGTGDYDKDDLIAIMALIKANSSSEDAAITTIITNAGYDSTALLEEFDSYSTALTYYLKFASYYEFFKDEGAYTDATYNTTNMALLLTYIIDNASDSDLASDIASVSDEEILAMLDKALPDSYSVAGTTSNGFTYGDDMVAVVDAITYGSTYYRSSVTSTSGSTITVTIDNDNTTLTILARGSGSITVNDTANAVTTTAAEYTWTLAAGTYTITIPSGVYIYNLGTEYTASGTSSDMTMSGNYATFTMTNGTYTVGSTAQTGLSGYGISSVTNYLTVTSSTTITFVLPASVSSRSIYIYGKRSGSSNVYAYVKNDTISKYVQLNNTLGQKNTSGISGSEFTLTFSGSAIIYAISFDSRTTYYEFEDMICIDDVYYPCFAYDSDGIYTPTVTISADAYSCTYYSAAGQSASAFEYALESADADSVTLTASTTTQTYENLELTNGMYMFVSYGLTYIDTVYETINTTNESSDSYYSNITAADLTYSTSNDYFSISDNPVEYYIATKYLESVGARYRMDLTGLTGSVTSDTNFASGNIVLHSNSSQSTTITDTSVTVAGMTYSNAAILTPLSGTYITFTTTEDNCYLYIMCAANANAKFSVSDGTNTYYYTPDQSNGFMTIKLPSAGDYTVNTVNAYVYIYDLYVVNPAVEASALTNLYANTAAKGEYLLSIFDSYSNYVSYNTRYELFNDATNISVADFDYDDVVKLLYATTTTDMELYEALTDEQVVELFKALFGYSDDFLKNAIADSTTSYITKDYLIYEISALCQANPDFLVDVFELANIDSSNITDSSGNYYDWVMQLIAAYVGTDLISNIDNETMTSSAMYTILDALENTTTFADTNFISSDTTIDNVKYQNLMSVLGVDLSTSGYGIYALASSRGIKNGTFLPDNLSLSTMDSWYEYDSTTGTYVLIEETEDKSANWRGGTSSDAEDDSDTESVNYAFYDEMKQLVKSISTVVFELSLTDATTGYTYYAYESQIDYTDKTITIYVPTGTTVSSSLTIASFVIADNATAYLLTGSTVGAQLYTSTYTQGSTAYTKGSQIRVYAEDTSVYADYTIEFVEADFSFDLAIDSSSDDEVSTSDGSLIVNLTSPSSSDTSGVALPEGMDIYPYITIYDADGNAVEDAFTLNEDAVVDSTGKAVLDMIISSSLAAGTYTLTVSIYGVSKSITFTKEASSDTTFTTFEFDGSDIASTLNSKKTVTSNIQWGRAYDYTALSDLDDSDFYLGEIEAALGATIEITSVTKSVSNNIMTYTIVYTVTAEDSSTTTYTHKLVETAAYSTGGAYATVYQDGTAVDTLTWSSTNTIEEEFNRGSQPLYRVKYNLNNFYTAGVSETYSITRDEDDNVTAETVTNGMSIRITNSADAGSYDFNYVFANSGVWSDNTEYTREYTFPTVTITKNYATNSLLDGVTFINSNKKTGSLATVINPDHPLRPDSEDSDGNDITSTFADGEVLYADLANESASQTVTVDDSGNISYTNSSTGTDYSTYSDYYIIGSVSNATLSSYAPSFDVDEYAEIYQYTTIAKLTTYGLENNQTLSDEEILENRDTILLYVPYVDADNNTVIFLVEIDDDLSWIKAYTTDYVGTTTSATETAVTFDTTTKAITYDGTSYTVADCAGDPDTTENPNSSLYMNYYGDPLEYHFWYVSYIIFSEAAFNGEDSDGYQCYHISIIDTNNTIQFDVTFDATGLASTEALGDSLYVRFVYDYYDSEGNVTVGSISFYLYLDTDSTSETYGMYIMSEAIKLQMLPRAYYYLYVSLPSGYTATYVVTTSGKSNKNVDGSGEEINTDESGSYLPPATIVPQSISILATITTTDETSSSDIWGIGTSTETEIIVTPAED
nr:hypothetical protein [Acholeplasmatales bacterium]